MGKPFLWYLLDPKCSNSRERFFCSVKFPNNVLTYLWERDLYRYIVLSFFDIHKRIIFFYKFMHSHNLWLVDRLATPRSFYRPQVIPGYARRNIRRRWRGSLRLRKSPVLSCTAIEISENTWISIEFQWFPLISNGFHWLSMIFIDFRRYWQDIVVKQAIRAGSMRPIHDAWHPHTCPTISQCSVNVPECSRERPTVD